MTKKAWLKLNNRQKQSEIERFEYIMSKINNMANGVDSDVDYESRISALEDKVQALEDELAEKEDDEADRLGKVIVTVKHDDEPVAHAGVELANDNGSYTGTTGSAGGCTINNIPIGEYDVYVSLNDGNTFEYGKFNVQEGDNNLAIDLITFNAETEQMVEEDGEW